MNPPRPVLIATRNAGKVREIVAILTADDPLWKNRVEWRSLDDVKIRIADPEETEPTLEGNAALKARYWSRHTGLWTLADDSGLEVDALNGAPGVFSARYSQLPSPSKSEKQDGSFPSPFKGEAKGEGETHVRTKPSVARTDREIIDAANNHKLIAALAGVPDDRRTARFRCFLAVADGERIVAAADGAIEGRIIDQPRGAGGFGYDPHFLIPALNKTTAELSLEAKNGISHRGQALRQLRDRLAPLL